MAAMPSATIPCVGKRVRSRSPNTTRPRRGGVSPRMERMSAVLPEPFDPSRQVMLPGSTATLTSSRTSARAYAVDSPSTRSPSVIPTPDSHASLEESLGERLIESAQQVAGVGLRVLHLPAQGAAPDQVEPQTVVEALVIADHQVVEDGERQAKAGALEGARDPGPIDRLRAQAGDAGGGEFDLSGAGREQPGQHVEEGRLAGPVRSDEAEDAAFVEPQIEPVERDHAAEAPGQLLALEQGRVHAVSGSRRSRRGRSPTGRKMRISTTIPA